MKKDLPVLAGLVLLGAAVFLAGVKWGLPSREVDRYLFGHHPVWSGQEIVARGGGLPAADDKRSVDVSANPIDPSRVVVLNATDEQRARIIRRYRLSSYHPDEILTFYALSMMKPARHKFDPRFYTYGGLWIYPVGGILKLCGIAGLAQIKSDLAWYLDRPEDFGCFYVVGRIYSASWALVGIVAVFLFVRRTGGGTAASAVGALCFTFAPIAIVGAHESKPHLAGAVLMLLTVLAGAIYSESGDRKWRLAASILAGSALGMVPSSLPVLIVPLGMEFLRGWPENRTARLRVLVSGMRGTVIAALVYCVTNPYVPINFIRNRAVVQSNFSHTSGNLRASWLGPPSALLLIGLVLSFVVAGLGLVGVAMVVKRTAGVWHNSGPTGLRKQSANILLVLLALIAVTPFASFAFQQGATFARFGIFFAITLIIEAVVFVENAIQSRRLRIACFAMMVLTTAAGGISYIRGFVLDSQPVTSRITAAQEIEDMVERGYTAIAIPGDPAPYKVPPINLWTTLISYPGLQKGAVPEGAQAKVFFNKNPDARPEISSWICSTPASFASIRFEIVTVDRTRDARKQNKIQ